MYAERIRVNNVTDIRRIIFFGQTNGKDKNGIGQGYIDFCQAGRDQVKTSKLKQKYLKYTLTWTHQTKGMTTKKDLVLNCAAVSYVLHIL